MQKHDPRWIRLIPVMGVAAVEGWSGNGRYYFASNLKKLHGESVSMLWEHQGSPEKPEDKIPSNKIIGQCRVYWYFDKLIYAGEVKDQFAWCVKKSKGASIGIFVKTIGLAHGLLSTGHALGDYILAEVSLTENAGIAATTISQWDQASLIKFVSHMQ